jgi:phenylalanyl-tRNA synthetase beta chain
MHPVDIIEDIAIAYGYDNIEMHHLKSYTVGKTFHINDFIDKVREIMIGLGYQEVMSAILSNKELLYDKMNISELETVELKEFSSERYSAVRTWLIPILMEVLSKNKHVDYPQRIFEEGLVTVRDKDSVKDVHRIALAIANADAGFTEARQALDSLLSAFGVSYKIEEAEHDSFIPGRVGRVIVNGKKVAYIGEINPKVLSNFEINVPVCGFELNVSELFEILNK